MGWRSFIHFGDAASLLVLLDEKASARLAARLAVARTCGGKGGGSLRLYPIGNMTKLGLAESSNTTAGET